MKNKKRESDQIIERNNWDELGDEVIKFGDSGDESLYNKTKNKVIISGCCSIGDYKWVDGKKIFKFSICASGYYSNHREIIEYLMGSVDTDGNIIPPLQITPQLNGLFDDVLNGTDDSPIDIEEVARKLQDKIDDMCRKDREEEEEFQRQLWKR